MRATQSLGRTDLPREHHHALEQADEWKEAAIILLYDDSDGWYDHVMGPIANQSNVTDDQLLGRATAEHRRQWTRKE